MPPLPQTYVSIILKLLFSLLALILTVVTQRILRNVLQARVKDPAQMRTLNMLVRNSVFLVGSVVILLIWLGFGSNFTVAMGILGAGIAFASQEVIGSFAGYVNIVTSNLFRIGDRVRIGDVVGDVLDVSILRTTVMEIGEWVKADQYTGRIVTVANRVVFSAPVFNYSSVGPTSGTRSRSPSPTTAIGGVRESSCWSTAESIHPIYRLKPRLNSVTW